jgi:hypothetical protein
MVELASIALDRHCDWAVNAGKIGKVALETLANFETKSAPGESV